MKIIKKFLIYSIFQFLLFFSTIHHISLTTSSSTLLSTEKSTFLATSLSKTKGTVRIPYFYYLLTYNSKLLFIFIS